MNRSRLIALLLVVPIAALVWWIASNTYWADTKVPTPLKGEARTNPFYAAQKFAEGLGAHTKWDRVFTATASADVVVLHTWHWSLSATRRQALERWVEAGGRLVVDDSLAGGEEEFEEWSGIEWGFRNLDQDDEALQAWIESTLKEPCQNVEGAEKPRRVCDLSAYSFLRTAQPIVWQLRNQFGIQAIRVTRGQGSVTVINASPFQERSIFDGDHGWLLVAATELRKGDRVLLLSERDHPSLLALTWQYGAPVVVLALAWVALSLWRGSVRFGPLAAVPETARRSLAEQIRGTGQFVLRHGNGDALHAACVRALNEAAQRLVPNYAQLLPDERVAVLARLTRFDRQTLAAAVHETGVRRSHNLRSTIALLESVRRQLIIDHTHQSYGTSRNQRHH